MTEVFLILIVMAVLWIVALIMLALVWMYGTKKKDRRKQNGKRNDKRRSNQIINSIY